MLVFYQRLYYALHGVAVLCQHGLCPVVLFFQYAANFLIHARGYFFGEVALVSPILGNENLCLSAKEHRAYFVAHAEFNNHPARKLGSLLQVAVCAGAYIV